jgi:hypothetical protein
MKNIALLFTLALLSGCATHHPKSGAEVEYRMQPYAVYGAGSDFYGGYVVQEYYEPTYLIRREKVSRNPSPTNHAYRQNFDSRPVPPVSPTPRFSPDNKRGNSRASTAGNNQPGANLNPARKPALAPAPQKNYPQNFQNHQQALQASQPVRNDAVHKPASSGTFGNATPKTNNQFGKANADNKMNDRPAFQAPRQSESGASKAGKQPSDAIGKFSKRP